MLTTNQSTLPIRHTKTKGREHFLKQHVGQSRQSSNSASFINLATCLGTASIGSQPFVLITKIKLDNRPALSHYYHMTSCIKCPKEIRELTLHGKMLHGLYCLPYIVTSLPAGISVGLARERAAPSPVPAYSSTNWSLAA